MTFRQIVEKNGFPVTLTNNKGFICSLITGEHNIVTGEYIVDCYEVSYKTSRGETANRFVKKDDETGLFVAENQP